jgi:hypothetical protein
VCDTLKPRLDEIRVRERAERICDEINETIRRIGQKT